MADAVETGPGVGAARRPLRVGVRLARSGDKAPVLAFASTTWDGWDYIPDAWDAWLTAPDGLLLVAETIEPDVDAEGRPLEAGRVVALARVTLLAEGEAWVEGIRVDPAVRARDVATNLQVAELAWAAAHDVSIVRYATGRDNEASHRLGARHGFHRLADRRAYGLAEEDHLAERPTDPSAVRTLELDPAGRDLARWWELVEGDPIFLAGERLYECRRWAFQALTAERFARHAARGEVLLARDEHALAIVPRSRSWPHDGHTHQGADVALVAGDGRSALSLLNDLRRAAGAPPRIRLPDPLPEGLAGAVIEAWQAAGFGPHHGALHLLARELVPGQALPAANPADALTYLEAPRVAATPPVL